MDVDEQYAVDRIMHLANNNSGGLFSVSEVKALARILEAKARKG